MRLYGLIGYPLGHSFSKKYFTEKFDREGIDDARFELFPLPDLSGLPALLRANPALRGLGVTIPHKESVVAMLDEVDDTARAIGAVNSIRVERGKLTGYNTDAEGFGQSLKNLDGGKWTTASRRAVILGTGGASKAVAYALRQCAIPYQFVSRNPAGQGHISYEQFRRLAPELFDIIINTTPLGTHPEVEQCPDVPFERLSSEHLVYDLVYNPAETLLLQRARARGCAVKNGLEMLQLQAEASWKRWN
ncbi:MAG: shikimate dehydrogenase [Lewinellaceae bacterium]|nr:shikimate dehydrogenase [Saprospiraceae bacterium]MCB9356769.1 shikimate dehydrogenase [Lewinellaceae bacterium]